MTTPQLPLAFGQKVLIAGLSSLALTGCAFRTQTTGMAVEYNEFIAQTTNRQTVLNILRAREREPMHFSSFSEVFGTVKGSVNPSVGFAFNGDSGSITNTATELTKTDAGGALTATDSTSTLTEVANVGATNVNPVSVGVQITTGTDFKIAANAGDEFYKGILNPIPASTVIHYLRQGFPADLLSHLLIGRLEFHAQIKKLEPASGKYIDEGDPIPLTTIVNSPDEPASAAKFDAAIRCRQLAYGVTRKPVAPIPLGELANFTPVPADMLKRVRPVEDETTKKVVGYVLTSPTATDFSLDLSKPNTSQCDNVRGMLQASFRNEAERRGFLPVSNGATLYIGGAPKALQGATSGGGRDSVSGADREALRDLGSVNFSSEDYFKGLPAGMRGDLVIDLTLRSTQGVLYYLGEYIRFPEQSPRLFAPECGTQNDGYCLPVLRVDDARLISKGRRFLEVSYRGRRYGVPLAGATLSKDAGRSSQTIDIVQQLLNLNRSSKDLPSTPLVRVAN